MSRVALTLARLAIAILGIAVFSFSIAGFFWAGRGSDPTSVLVEGLSRRLELSHGTSSTIVNISLLLILLSVRRSKIGIATILCATLAGPFIAVFQKTAFAYLPQNPGFVIGVLASVTAVILNGVGLGLYLAAGLGASVFDGIVLTMSEVMGFSHKMSMTVFYALVFSGGLLLGGSWGIGTILSLTLCGWAFERSCNVFGEHLSFLRKSLE